MIAEKSFRRLMNFACLALTLGIFAQASRCHAADELGSGMREAASNIVAVMKAVRAESITVKPFEDKTTFGATTLAGLQRELSDALTQLKVNVKQAGGAVGVKGVVKLAKDVDESKFLRVEFQLTDADGEDLKSLNVQVPRPGYKPNEPGEEKIDVKGGKLGQDFIDGAASLVAFGGTVDRTAPPIGKEVDALNESLKNPTAKIVNGVTAKASADSPFEVQVLVGGKPKSLRIVDGQPFVDLKEGEKFTVKVSSQAPFKTTASLSLDGLNSFHFSKLRKANGAPKLSNWVLNHSAIEVKGWHVDNTIAQEFVASSYDKSKLKEAGMAETPIGAVTVIFRSAWDSDKQDTQRPKDEYDIRQPLLDNDGKPKIGKDGKPLYETVMQVGGVYIAGGDDIEQNVREVKVQSGRVRAAISIRYRHPLSGETGN